MLTRDPASKAYKIERILPGENWNKSARSPLTAVGVNVKPGDYIIAVNGTPVSTHFYTPYSDECQTVKANPDWQFESVAFFMENTNPTDGSCPAGTTPLYRLYNNGLGGAPNHRYTTNRAIFDQMVGLGWVAEGNGPQTIFACGPG